MGLIGRTELPELSGICTCTVEMDQPTFHEGPVPFIEGWGKDLELGIGTEDPDGECVHTRFEDLIDVISTDVETRETCRKICVSNSKAVEVARNVLHHLTGENWS
jgi:hypothetical protein